MTSDFDVRSAEPADTPGPLIGIAMSGPSPEDTDGTVKTEDDLREVRMIRMVATHNDHLEPQCGTSRHLNTVAASG